MSLRRSAPISKIPPWLAPAFLAGLTIYGLLFFTAMPERLGCLPALLLPDEIVLSWVDGDLGRFGLLDRMPVLLAALLILGIGFVFGRLTLRALQADHGLSNLEVAVFSIGAGLNELSLITLALGLAGLLQQPWLFLALFAVAALVYVWQWWQGVFPSAVMEQGTNGHDHDVDRFAKYGIWLGLPFLLMILFGGMMPPWDFDVREYHLQVPKEWYLSGKISFLPHNVYGNMPLGAEMHAVLGMVFGPGELGWWWGAMVGKTVMAAFAPLTALALVAAGQRLKHLAAGVTAALIYISSPWTVYISVTGLNEGAVAFFLTLTVYAVLLWMPQGNQEDASVAHRANAGRLLLAGFFAGSAVACKYPAVLFLVLPVGAWVLLSRRRLDWKPALLFTLAVLCGCGLWLGKNAAFTGNPMYPLVFGGYTRTPERMEQWNRAHRVPQDAQGHCYTPEAAAQAATQVGWRSPWLNPLVLPLAALALAGRRWRKLVTFLGLFSAYFLVTWWLCTHRIDRFWVPLLPVLSLLAGIGAAQLWQHPWKRVMIGTLAIGLAWNALFLLTNKQLDRRYLISLAELRCDRPTESLGPSRINPVHRWLDVSVPDGCCVLLVGDALPFDLEVPALYNTCFDANLLEQLVRDRTRKQRLQAFADHKISHVYIRWCEVDRYRSPGNYGFTDYVTRELIRKELVQRQRILRPVDLGLNSETDEVFAVNQEELSLQAQDTALPARPR